MWEAGREKGRGSGAPEVPATAVLGQHVAAAALKVQQAAVEGAVMRVSEGHAGSGPGQAAGTAAAGTQGGGLVLASAPHTVRPAALPAGPHAKPPGKIEPPREPGRFPGSRAPAGGGQDATSWPCQTLHDPGEPGLLLPRCSRWAVPRAHPSHRPRLWHSRAHRRAAGSAGCGSARCLPRRSSWCRRPRPSALRRPPAGPGARTTGRGLRGREGERQMPVPHVGSRSVPPTPSPMALARTLAPLTAPASLPHLRPAARAGERLALLQAALHMAPLRTNVIALGTSGRVWSPWPHASASRTGQATLLPQGHPLHDQVGGEITFSCLPSHRGTSALSPRGGAFF